MTIATTVTLRATTLCNERYTPGAAKPYLARITGRSSAHTFEREFLARETTFDAASCPALLERVDVDKKGRRHDPDYILLLPADGDQVERLDLDKADAMWLAAQLDAGRNLDDCWGPEGRVSAAAAAKQQAAATVEAAVEACLAALGGLDPAAQRKALAAAKARLTQTVSEPAAETEGIATTA